MDKDGKAMTRHEHDLYTSQQTEALVRILMDGCIYPNHGFSRIHGRILEPCAGPSKMADALRLYDSVSNVVTGDINPLHSVDLISDASRSNSRIWNPDHTGEVDYVVTNPPFNLAHKILPKALKAARCGVAFLLRLSYAEPCEKGNSRGQWLTDHADQQIWQSALNPRPNFKHGLINPKTGKEYGTDNVTVAWFVWQKKWSWKDLGILPPFDYATNWRG